MKIYRIDEILNKLENCIVNKIPFSHIRFGDGGVKFLHSILFNDTHQLKIISKKEGLPLLRIGEVFNLWGYYSRRADFIDTPEVYFHDTFWDRTRTEKKAITKQTKQKLEMWLPLYRRAEMDNESYCNPESNYLMILNNVHFKNLFDVMEGRKIGIITAKPKVKTKLMDYDVEVIKIVGHYENQYNNSFLETMHYIKHNAKKYDFWLVAAGELGRLYSGYIKKCGGRTIDLGFVIEFWLGQEIHPRLQKYMIRSEKNPLCLCLTDEGRKYERYI